jgi:hypothetical protein
MKWELLVVTGLLAIITISGCIGQQQIDLQKEVEELTKKGDIIRSCLDSRILIQKARYYEDNQSLELTFNNFGRVDLNLSILLTYGDDIESRPEIYIVGAGDIESITIDNVSNDLVEVTVKSKECTQAQDFRTFVDIKGLGY